MAQLAYSKATSEELSKIEAVVRPVLAAHGVELFEIELGTQQHGWVLTVTVDVLDGAEAVGVSVDQCADISRDISTAMDVADPIDRHYSLVVSSPGVERKLRGLADFQRYVGKLAKVTLARSQEGIGAVVRGIIMGVEGSVVTIDMAGRLVPVDLAQIKRAHLVFEWAGQAKPGTTSKKKGQPARGRK